MLHTLGIEPPPPAAPALEGIVGYILDNAGGAIPDHSPTPERIAVRWREVVAAARAVGVELPASPPRNLREHPGVERVNWPVRSPGEGRAVKCVVLRRPPAVHPPASS